MTDPAFHFLHREFTQVIVPMTDDHGHEWIPRPWIPLLEPDECGDEFLPEGAPHGSSIGKQAARPIDALGHNTSVPRRLFERGADPLQSLEACRKTSSGMRLGDREEQVRCLGHSPCTTRVERTFPVFPQKPRHFVHKVPLDLRTACFREEPIVHGERVGLQANVLKSRIDIVHEVGAIEVAMEGSVDHCVARPLQVPEGRGVIVERCDRGFGIRAPFRNPTHQNRRCMHA